MGVTTTLLDNFKASSSQKENDVTWELARSQPNCDFLGPAKAICLSSVRRIQHSGVLCVSNKCLHVGSRIKLPLSLIGLKVYSCTVCGSQFLDIGVTAMSGKGYCE